MSALPIRRRTSPVGTPSPEGSIALYQPGVRNIWRFLLTQPPSYWLVCTYLFMEYVRPQSIYESLAFFPWSLVVILLCLAAFLIEGRFFDVRGSANLWLAIFTGIILFSCVRAFSPSVAIRNLPLWFSWVLIYLLISNIVITERRFLVFMLSFLLYNLKMSIYAVRSWASIGFHFRNWGVNGAPGWFSNSGEFGIEMCVFVAVSAYFVAALWPHWNLRRRLLFMTYPATAVIGMVASSSRGALIGCAAVALWVVLTSKHRIRGLLIAATLTALVILIIPPEQMQRFSHAGEDHTSQLRLLYWARGLVMLRENPITGVGFFNWLPYYYSHYGPGQLPHNIFIQAAAELGYPGFLALLGLIGATFVTNYRTRRMARLIGRDGRFLFFMALGLDAAVIGYVGSGFWVTVLYYPYMWINLAMTVALYRAAVTKYRQFVIVAPGAVSQASWGRDARQ